MKTGRHLSISEKFQANRVLAPLTTFKIGGPAKFYFEAKNRDDLMRSIKWAEKNKEQCFFLGGGSNLLVNDKGVDGLVVRLCNEDIEFSGNKLRCGAGVALAKAAKSAAACNLSGLEWSLGIPRATIGGAVRGNAEAFGISMGLITKSCLAYDIVQAGFKNFSNKKCRFEYRDSIFKHNSSLIIWEAVLELKREKPERIKALTEQSIGFRKEKYSNLPSAGSVFKNLDAEYVKKNNPELADHFLESHSGRLGKIGAGYVIDELGLRGKTIGGAKISDEHGNFIVNTGTATAEDVATMISYIKQQVRDKYGLQLQEEIVYFGF